MTEYVVFNSQKAVEQGLMKSYTGWAKENKVNLYTPKQLVGAYSGNFEVIVENVPSTVFVIAGIFDKLSDTVFKEKLEDFL